MDRWMDETLYPQWGQRLKADRVLFEDRTTHQHLVIFENALLGRVMMLDGCVQVTTHDEYVYHEMMSHVPLFALGEPKRVLIIGGGDGGLMREVLRHPGIEKVTLCEIDRGVVDMSLKYFPGIAGGAFDDPRAELVIADGVKLVAETDQRYDAILVDSTDPHGPGAVLFTRSFYASCHRCLNQGGVLVTQNGVPFFQGPELTQSVGYFRELFKTGSCYLACTPTYIGGFMAYGWATDAAELSAVPLPDLERRYAASGLTTKYYTPKVHQAAFALPGFVQTLVD